MVTGRGHQAEMPRGAALPRKPVRSEVVIWGVAVGLASVFAIGQIATIMAAAPVAISYFARAGSSPWFVQFVASIGPIGLLLGLFALDVVLLAVPLWLARRYWIGFAFLPPILYLGSGSIVLWLLLADALNSAVFGG